MPRSIAGIGIDHRRRQLTGQHRLARGPVGFVEAMDREALGRRLGHGPWLTVVGVVGGVRQRPLDLEPGPEVYLPLAQAPSPQ